MQPNQQGYYQPGQGQPPEQTPQPQQTAAPADVAPVSTPAPQVLGSAAVQGVVGSGSEPVQAVRPQDSYEVSEDALTWTAHEYIHQEKGKKWFFGFAIVMAVLFVGSLLLQWWTFAVVVVVIVAVIIVSSKRPPRELNYSLSDDGLAIDGKLHKFEEFKAFGIIRDGEAFSFMLIPTQRFQPGVTVYFPEDLGEDIVDELGARLPMKELSLDAVDKLVRLLRL